MSVQEFVVTVVADPHPTTDSTRPGSRLRRHRVGATGKPTIDGSSAPMFHGEASRWNPEELFVASLAQCHYLSFVYVTTVRGIEVLDYSCEARGTLQYSPDGHGQITDVTLHPVVSVGRDHAEMVEDAHAEAHELCFIARSVSCEVTVKPETRVVS